MYITNLEEVRQAYDLADEDKKFVIESENKIVIVVELTKEQAKKLK